MMEVTITFKSGADGIYDQREYARRIEEALNESGKLARSVFDVEIVESHKIPKRIYEGEFRVRYETRLR